MATIANERKLLTLREVASLLRLSETTVRRLIDSRGLPALKVGGSIRVDAAELETWLFEDPASPCPPGDPVERPRTPDLLPAVEVRAHTGDDR